MKILSAQFDINWNSHTGPVIFVGYKNKKIGFTLCHRREDRSIKLWGFQSPLCARCMGMCFGFVLALILGSAGVLLHPILALFLLAPLIIDGVSQNFGYRESTNLIRVVTGILFSLGFISLIRGLT
ncbi:MAG: DUF2085 domain-containing protein [Candidatus Altiarchaeales archaeon]|nr:DUF2085 domain-containing protein [Candidatus Altiarchaeales archaeon]